MEVAMSYQDCLSARLFRFLVFLFLFLFLILSLIIFARPAAARAICDFMTYGPRSEKSLSGNSVLLIAPNEGDKLLVSATFHAREGGGGGWVREEL